MTKPANVDDYIANAAAEARPKLEELRKLIKSAVPQAEESISWNVPFYKRNGPLCGFAVYTNHVSLGFSAAELGGEARKALEQTGYGTGKRTLQIRFDQRIPATAIKQILKAQATMNATKTAGRESVPKSATKAPAKSAAPRSTVSAKASSVQSASKLIDVRIKELGDWRGETLARLRALVKEADPNAVETWKWRGVPVWEDHGIICTGETYQSVVKMTFARGAALPDPARLFNSSLDGNVRRAIDIKEGDKINATALKALVRAAVKLNQSKAKK